MANPLLFSPNEIAGRKETVRSRIIDRSLTTTLMIVVDAGETRGEFSSRRFRGQGLFELSTNEFRIV